MSLLFAKFCFIRPKKNQNKLAITIIITREGRSRLLGASMFSVTCFFCVSTFYNKYNEDTITSIVNFNAANRERLNNNHNKICSALHGLLTPLYLRTHFITSIRAYLICKFVIIPIGWQVES